MRSTVLREARQRDRRALCDLWGRRAPEVVRAWLRRDGITAETLAFLDGLDDRRDREILDAFAAHLDAPWGRTAVGVRELAVVNLARRDPAYAADRLHRLMLADPGREPEVRVLTALLVEGRAQAVGTIVARLAETFPAGRISRLIDRVEAGLPAHVRLAGDPLLALRVDHLERVHQLDKVRILESFGDHGPRVLAALHERDGRISDDVVAMVLGLKDRSTHVAALTAVGATDVDARVTEMEQVLGLARSLRRAWRSPTARRNALATIEGALELDRSDGGVRAPWMLSMLEPELGAQLLRLVPRGQAAGLLRDLFSLDHDRISAGPKKFEGHLAALRDADLGRLAGALEAKLVPLPDGPLGRRMGRAKRIYRRSRLGRAPLTVWGRTRFALASWRDDPREALAEFAVYHLTASWFPQAQFATGAHLAVIRGTWLGNLWGVAFVNMLNRLARRPLPRWLGSTPLAERPGGAVLPPLVGWNLIVTPTSYWALKGLSAITGVPL